MSGWYSSFEGYNRKELRHALKRADPSIFERVLQFLEDDPKTFGSGYAKTIMWQCIRRYELDDSNIQQLEHAALKYLERPMRPEYKRMCQAMSFIGTPFFWQAVELQLQNQNPITQINAYCLYEYSKGLLTGERKRLELRPIKREIKRKNWERKVPRYGPFFYEKHVLEVVTNLSVWRENKIVYRKANEADLPIIRHGGYSELAELDFSHCKVDEVIEALSPILIQGNYHDVSTISAWILIFYIFGELKSDQAISLTEQFYNSRIANQFESAKKWLTTQAVYRALQRIGTPKALQVSLKYQHRDPLNDAHMRSFTIGWLTNQDMII